MIIITVKLPHGFDSNQVSNPTDSKFNQKNSLLESRLICTQCVWTQSLLQTMSPWLLPLLLWLYHVSCRAQTPTPAMVRAPLPFLHSALLKLRRLLLPSRPISGSSNRRNTRTANRWIKTGGGGTGAARLTDNRKQGRMFTKRGMNFMMTCTNAYVHTCKCAYIQIVWQMLLRVLGLVTVWTVIYRNSLYLKNLEIPHLKYYV